MTKNTDAGVANFYLTDEKTGEVYKEVAFDYRKDSDAPQFTNVKDGDTYTVNSRRSQSKMTTLPALRSTVWRRK